MLGQVHFSGVKTLLRFRSSLKYLYLHYLCNLLTCGHQIWILGIPEMVQQIHELDQLFEVRGIKWTNQILGQIGWHKW